MGRAQAARALGDNNCAHCSVRASSPTARRHSRIAPLALPDHQASLRCGGRGRAALLPTRRAPPPTAESLQLRCCFSALGATPLMRLRTRSRQQGVNERARGRLRATRINTNAACANGTTCDRSARQSHAGHRGGKRTAPSARVSLLCLFIPAGAVQTDAAVSGPANSTARPRTRGTRELTKGRDAISN